MSFQQVLLILAARWRLGACVFGVIVMAAVLITVLMPRKYTASTSVVIDDRSDPLTGSAAQDQNVDFLVTQVNIAQSPRVLQRAVNLLKLEKNSDHDDKAGLSAFDADDLADQVDVEPAHDSNVLQINASAENAETAARIANAVAQAYLDIVVELKVDPAKENAGWFDERTKELRADLQNKQKIMSEFESQHRITATDERADIESARLNDLSSQLTAVQAQRQDSESKAREIAINGDAAPEVLQSGLISQLKADLAHEQAQLEDVSTTLGKNHPSYRDIKAQIDSLEARISQESARVASSLNTANQVNIRRESDLREALEAQKQRVLQSKHDRDRLDILRSDVDAAQHNLEAVTLRLAQVGLESQMKQAGAVILTPATPPRRPSSPKVRLNLALGMFLGAVLGLAGVFIRELNDRRVRSSGELVELLEVPLLGSTRSASPKALGWSSRGLLRLSGPGAASDG